MVGMAISFDVSCEFEVTSDDECIVQLETH